MTDTLHVPLGERSYDIHVGPGLFARAGELLAPLACGVVPVVTDKNIADRLKGYYGDTAGLTWERSGGNTRVTLLIPCAERRSAADAISAAANVSRRGRRCASISTAPRSCSPDHLR